MENQTIRPDAYIWITVESTTNIQAWAPVLFKMKDDSLIDVFSSVKFNDDGTRILWESADQSLCGFQIGTTVRVLKEHLSVFAERTRLGDVISVWESVSELEDLIDEIAEMNTESNDIARQLKKGIERPTIDEEIPDEIKSSSAEELAEQIIAFAKKEFADQGSPIRTITSMFWDNKNVIKWNLPANLRLKIEKADRLAQKQLEIERDGREKDELLSLVDPCVEWAKKYRLKKVSEADTEAFILERNIHGLTRAKKRSLSALVNIKLKNK